MKIRFYHYDTFQCFIVTAIKRHGNKADLI